MARICVEEIFENQIDKYSILQRRNEMFVPLKELKCHIHVDSKNTFL